MIVGDWKEIHAMDIVNKKLLKYLIITFAITYLCWGGLAVLVQTDVLTFAHPVATIMHLLGGFGPPIAALFVLDTKITGKSLVKIIFGSKPKTAKFFFIFALMEILVIGLSSMELNSAVPLYLVPVILVQATVIYGGNEELGWRGVMQSLLEEKYSFPVATLITGAVWGVWHLPLWFVDGASQQNIPFALFLILGILLSFFFAAVYKKTKSVFYCCAMHGLTNTLLSVFIIKINAVLVIGLLMMLGYSIYRWYSEKNKE